MDTLKISVPPNPQTNGYFDSLKSRNTKSALSNSSSGSSNSSNRASVVEPLERNKSVGSRSPVSNGKAALKVSHL
jgi:hypothetical protein